MWTLSQTGRADSIWRHQLGDSSSLLTSALSSGRTALAIMTGRCHTGLPKAHEAPTRGGGKLLAPCRPAAWTGPVDFRRLEGEAGYQDALPRQNVGAAGLDERCRV